MTPGPATVGPVHSCVHANETTRMTVSLQCRCGTVRGTLAPRHAFARATCYCKDCRAFAAYLGSPGLADASGGVDIIATAPSSVRITAGHDQLACMALSPKGLLRWYAACCRTPLANTARNTALPYVGVTAACLDGAQVDRAFGPRDRITLNTGSATGPVRRTPLAFALGGLRILAGMLGARLRRDRTSPFFGADGQAVRVPDVISRERRTHLERADG